jgi:hypothetical protein
MSSPTATGRQLFAHAIVVCGLVLGLTSFILAPLEKQRLQADRELAALRQDLSQAGERERILEAASVASESAAELRQAIADRSAGAMDELALHRVYHETSARWGVEIDRFDPSAVKVSLPRRNDDKLVLPAFAATVRIDAVAPLESIVGMLDELSRTAGFMSVRSLKMTPVADSDEKAVRIRLENDHYSFAVDTSAQATREEGN